MSKIAGLASQFATQYGLGCYSNLNFGIKFHTEFAAQVPYIKLRTLCTLNIIL